TYPLHLGVTEAGNGDDARIKSAVGIGSLLLDGLGDTIRVSLAEEPEAEIPVAREIAALCARPFAEGIASTPADEHEFNTPRLWSGGSAWPTAVGVPSRQTLPTERALATVNGPHPASAGGRIVSRCAPLGSLSLPAPPHGTRNAGRADHGRR